MWKLYHKVQNGLKSKDPMRRLSIVCEKTKNRCGTDFFKKPYLVAYNSLQAVGFAYILIHMSLLYLKLGTKSFPITYENVGPAMKWLHHLQIVEILHPVIGYSKGGPFIPFFQLLGREFIIMIMMEDEPRMQTNTLVPFLFVVWSIIEVIRHLYYVMHALNKSYPFLTWLRYSAWMILYPMGIVGEASVMYYNLPYFEETQRYSVTLPHPWNIAINFVLLMKIEIGCLLGPIMYVLTSHMYRNRVKHLKC